MTCHLDALRFDANDPLRLGRFWSGVLGWEMTDDPHDGIALLPGDDTGFRIRLLPTREQKAGANQIHFDLNERVPRGPAADGGAVARTRRPAHRHRQRPEEGRVVLADPDGNEFCVLTPG